MDSISRFSKIDKPLLVAIIILISFSLFALWSIAPYLFPLYFLYILLGVLAFFLFSTLEFGVISVFSKHLYVFSIFLLILPLLIGQVTRGAVRWIPIGALTIQPVELVRPLLLIFFANYLTKESFNFKRFIKAGALLAIPIVLLLMQPSLGVAILVVVSFVGVIIATDINKKYLVLGFLLLLLSLPLVVSVLAPYQKSRLVSFINPGLDPQGSGYNSIQSMISVGSGQLFGRGLGKGVQTQLHFLPESHSDFIYASISEELGFLGSIVILFVVFFILFRITHFMKNPVSIAARAFYSGVLLTLFFQTVVNIGMNLGLLPITGVPLPLVSAGGSSFLATMATFGLLMGARK